MTDQMSVINCLTTKHRKFGCIYGTQTGQIIAWDHVTTDILYSKKSLSHVSIQSIDCFGENIAAIDNKGKLSFEHHKSFMFTLVVDLHSSERLF